MSSIKVPFVNLGAQYLALRDEILSRFDDISRRGAYILGPEVQAFEADFAAYCGASYAVSVGNGSDALILVLWALGIGPGDEVIAPPNSFVATAWAIARTGARIVFADVADDMNIDPEKVGEAITARTKAIMPVHLTGRVSQMETLEKICAGKGIVLIEDSAQAVGAMRHGKRAGSFGVAAGFSLHPLKNLHAHGDGGVVTTNDEALRDKLVKYRNHGLRDRDHCEFWGINSRLDTIQAAIAGLKLKRLDDWNRRYREIAARYRTALCSSFWTPSHEAFEEPVYHRFMIRHPRRDALAAHLAAQGVETRVNYPIPLHLQEAAADLGHGEGDFPRAEAQARTILSLPIYPELEDAQVDYVIEKTLEFTKTC